MSPGPASTLRPSTRNCTRPARTWKRSSWEGWRWLLGTWPPGERYRSQASVPCPFPGGPIMTMRSPLSGFSITCGASGRPRDIALDTASREATSLPSSTGTFACTTDGPGNVWLICVIGAARSPPRLLSPKSVLALIHGRGRTLVSRPVGSAFGLRKRAYIPSRSYSWRRTRKAAGGGCP